MTSWLRQRLCHFIPPNVKTIRFENRPQSKKAIILLDDGLDFLGVAWLGRHHPEHSRRITGWIRTTQLDTSTVVTAAMARACVMALQIMTTP